MTQIEILESRAWDEMTNAAEAGLFSQFCLCDASDKERLSMIRNQIEALRSITSIMRAQATDTNNEG